MTLPFIGQEHIRIFQTGNLLEKLPVALAGPLLNGQIQPIIDKNSVCHRHGERLKAQGLRYKQRDVLYPCALHREPLRIKETHFLACTFNPVNLDTKPQYDVNHIMNSTIITSS